MNICKCGCGKECKNIYYKNHSPHSGSFKKGYTPFNKGKELSEEHKRRIGESHKGDKNPNWKGGISSLVMGIRNLNECKKWTQAVYIRDDYICRDCGVRGGKLQAHHIKPFSVVFKKFLEKYNQFSPIDDKDILIKFLKEIERKTMIWDEAGISPYAPKTPKRKPYYTTPSYPYSSPTKRYTQAPIKRRLYKPLMQTSGIMA